jgi:tetratricopeptide (TPR) repeat protein
LALLLASCGNLTCDPDKKESIERMNAGVDFAKRKSWALAEKELEQAVTLNPENHEANYALGQVYEEQKNWEKAVRAFENAIKYDASEAMYHYKLGKAYFEQANLNMALPSLEKAATMNPKLYKVHWYLGQIHRAQERPDKAAVALSESCRLNPQFGKAFYDLGGLYFDWDMNEQAVVVLEQGAQHARDDADRTNLYFQLGRAYDSLRKFDQAVEAYEKALGAKKDNMDARFQLGMALANKGDKAAARKQLDEFVKLGGGGNKFNMDAAMQMSVKLISEP